MQVRLTPRFVLETQGATTYLLDRQSESKFWPEDVLQPFPNWGFLSAAQHVGRMARGAMLKPDERALVDRFCTDLPTAPEPEAHDAPELRRIDP